MTTSAPNYSTDQVDAAFDSLADPTRRCILQALAEDAPQDDTFVECAVPEAPIDAALYHNHLPRMDGAGLIDWDREAGTADRGPNFGLVRQLLDVVDRVTTSR